MNSEWVDEKKNPEVSVGAGIHLGLITKSSEEINLAQNSSLYYFPVRILSGYFTLPKLPKVTTPHF